MINKVKSFKFNKKQDFINDESEIVPPQLFEPKELSASVDFSHECAE